MNTADFTMLTDDGKLMTCPLPADETVVEVLLDDGTACPAWYSCNIMEAGDFDFMPVTADGEPDYEADSIYPGHIVGERQLGETLPRWQVRAILTALSEAGYSIVHESEIHGATRERCIAALAKANARVPGVETPCMKGDNFAIILCSFFDDGDRKSEDDTGWSKAARDGYEEVITAIRDHYTGSLSALPDGGVDNG